MKTDSLAFQKCSSFKCFISFFCNKNWKIYSFFDCSLIQISVEMNSKMASNDDFTIDNCCLLN